MDSKIKSSTSKYIFAAISQVFGGRVLPAYDYFRTLFVVWTLHNYLITARSAAVESWEEPANIWLTVAKNAFVGWALNFRVGMLLKGAVSYKTEKLSTKTEISCMQKHVNANRPIDRQQFSLLNTSQKTTRHNWWDLIWFPWNDFHETISTLLVRCAHWPDLVNISVGGKQTFQWVGKQWLNLWINKAPIGWNKE